MRTKNGKKSIDDDQIRQVLKVETKYGKINILGRPFLGLFLSLNKNFSSIYMK